MAPRAPPPFEAAARQGSPFAPAAALDRLRRWLEAERSRIAGAVLAVGVLARAMVVIGKRIAYAPYGFDEQWFLWGGWSILKGLAPYRDFHDFKPPYLFLTEALAIACFGNEDQRFRLFFLGLAVVSVAALVIASIARGNGALLSLAIGLAIAITLFDPALHDKSINDVESIGLAYFLFGVSFLMGGRSRPWASGIGTAFLLICILTKEPFVFIAFPAWLAFFFDPPRESQGRMMRPWRSYLGASLLGGAVPVMLVLVYLGAIGGLRDYLSGYPRTRAFAETYAVLIHRFVPGTFREEQRQIWAYLNAGLFNLDHLAPWLPVFGAGLLATRGRHAPRMACGMLAIAGSAYAISVGHCFWMHYFTMGIAGLALFAVLSGFEIAAFVKHRRDLRIAGAMALLTLYPAVHARYEGDVKALILPAPLSVPPAIVEYVVRNTGPDDYILSTAPALYFYAERKSALTYNSFVDEVLATFPGDTDAERFARLRAQLQARMPKFVYVELVEPYRARRHMEELLNPFLKENGYTLVRDRLYKRPD